MAAGRRFRRGRLCVRAGSVGLARLHTRYIRLCRRDAGAHRLLRRWSWQHTFVRCRNTAVEAETRQLWHCGQRGLRQQRHSVAGLYRCRYSDSHARQPLHPRANTCRMLRGILAERLAYRRGRCLGHAAAYRPRRVRLASRQIPPPRIQSRRPRRRQGCLHSAWC